jgi:hypothetical protein
METITEQIRVLMDDESILTQENLLMIEWLEERTDLLEQFYLWLSVKEFEERELKENNVDVGSLN